MKIIDKTPFQNEKGQSGLVQRIQGMWEFGAAWQTELDAQRTVINQLERVLEKGFTLIRNLRLENSQIVEPLILIGPPGVFVIYVTPIGGFYEAKGDQWNVVKNDRREPAPINLMARVAQLARALQVYLNRQNMYLPGMFEPVLMATNPAVHIDQLRPMTRVVMSDAVKQFAVGLMQSRPVLKTPEIAELVDHIVRPHPKTAGEELGAEAVKASEAAKAPEAAKSPDVAKPAEAAQASEAPEAASPGQPAAASDAPVEADASEPASAQAPARARAIFHAAEELKPFDPADLSFAFDEKAGIGIAPGVVDAKAAPPPKTARRWAGMTALQWIVVLVMGLVACGAVGLFGYLIYANGL